MTSRAGDGDGRWGIRAATLLLLLLVVVAASTGVASALENFSANSTTNAEIGQASTTHDVTFDIDLVDGESTYVEIDTANLPVGASLNSPIIAVSSSNGNVTVSKNGVSGSVANVSVSDASAASWNPVSTTVTITLELDTSGVSTESTGVQYDLTETSGSTDTDTVDLVDTTAPTYDSVITGDSPTGDSTANDTLTLNITEAGTGINGSTVTAGDFTVDGSAPDSATSTTIGGQPVIQLTLGSAFATDATPTVDLAGSIADAAGNTLAGPVSKTATDGLVPTISSAAYNDTDGDGQVDRLNVTYSEAIAGGYTDGDWSIATAGTVSLAKDGTGSVSSPSVLLDVTGSADTTGGATAPEVSNSGSSITDASGNANAAQTATESVTDAAAPVNVSVQTTDANGDDEIDRIDVAYSEDVSASSPEAGDYSLGGTDAGSVSIDGVAVSGSDVRVSVSAPADTTDLDLTLSYDATAGAADSVTDGSQPAPSFTGAAVTDATPPAIDSATVLDRDGDGAVDAVNVTFSEPIDDSTLTASDFSVGGTALEAVDTLGSTDDASVQHRITTDANEVDGTDAKDLTYSPGSAADLAGNALAAVAAGDVAETDGANPVVSNFALTASGGSVVATFDVTETLASATVDVTGAETGSITSFSTSGSTHEGSLSVDTNGDHTGQLTAATDGAGNAASTGQSDTATVSGPGGDADSPDGSVALDDVSSRERLESSSGIVEVGALFEGTQTSTIVVREVQPAASGPPGTLVSTLEVTVGATVEDTPATLKFALERTRFDALDVTAADLVVYRYEDGEWTALPTRTIVGSELVRLVAETPGFSQFAVVVDSATADQTPTSTHTPTSSPTPGEPIETTTEPRESTDEPTSAPRTETDGMPGFTALLALLGLTATLAITWVRS